MQSTQDDIIGEVRRQYERNGIKFNDMSKAAADDVQTASQSSSALVMNLADSVEDAARETSGAVLDASGEIAKSSRTGGKRST